MYKDLSFTFNSYNLLVIDIAKHPQVRYVDNLEAGTRNMYSAMVG